MLAIEQSDQRRYVEDFQTKFHSDQDGATRAMYDDDDDDDDVCQRRVVVRVLCV